MIRLYKDRAKGVIVECSHDGWHLLSDALLIGLLGRLAAEAAAATVASPNILKTIDRITADISVRLDVLDTADVRALIDTISDMIKTSHDDKAPLNVSFHKTPDGMYKVIPDRPFEEEDVNPPIKEIMPGVFMLSMNDPESLHKNLGRLFGELDV